MDSRKLRVGILFGGKSAEHEVSLQSAKNIVDALDREKFEPVLIGIDKEGKWILPDSAQFLLNTEDPKLIALNTAQSTGVTLTPERGEVVSSDTSSALPVDVVFPILHGPFGEDGTVQGLLRLLGVPFVGSGVLGSAVGMDKDVMKRLLRDAGIPVARWITLRRGQPIDGDAIMQELGTPVFVKPANLGSSVGVHKVKDATELVSAIEDAFRYDTKVLIEEYIQGRELECAVLGNEELIASGVGEVAPTHDFYSYEAKYVDEHGAVLTVPADVDEVTTKRIQMLALDTFRVLCAEGLARVDVFLTPKGDIYVNEINTMPGFTKISMYPRLFEVSGISYRELITKLIELALSRHDIQKTLKTSRE